MLSVSCVHTSSYCVVGAQCCLCRVCSFCKTVWWVPNVVCVKNHTHDTDNIGHPTTVSVFVFLLCGGCPMLSVSTHTTQTTLGAQCCLCRVCSFCRLTVWWVPNVVCVVCVVFVVLLCGGCPMLSVSCVWFLSSYCVVGAQCCLCRVCSFCRLTAWWDTMLSTLCGGCPMLSVSCVWFLFSYCVVGAQCCLCRVLGTHHCVVSIVFVRLCGGCPMLSVSTHTTQTTLGTHHCVSKTVWWVPKNHTHDTDNIGPNPLCRVCGFCNCVVGAQQKPHTRHRQHWAPTMLSVSCVWFLSLTAWWVPNVVCVVCVVFVFLLCGGCPMLSVSCVWFLFSYNIGHPQCCHVCVDNICFLTVWWVPNVVCVTDDFLLCGGCPTHDTDNIGHPPHSKS